MLKAVLLLSLVAMALSQGFPGGSWWQDLSAGRVLDTIHGYKVQYDDLHDLVIVFDDNSCYLVEASIERRWDTIMTDEENLHAFTEKVYKQIQNMDGVSRISQNQAENDYHSRLEMWECGNKGVYLVAYNLRGN